MEILELIDSEALVDGDAELDGDVDSEGEEDTEDDGEEEIEDDGERLSIWVTLKTARLSLVPNSPATRVTRSPTAYPVPLFIIA